LREPTSEAEYYFKLDCIEIHEGKKKCGQAIIIHGIGAKCGARNSELRS
jgi:hypothetical protein